ncbi:MAG: lysophospholipid acyltransferase family protein, partial [Dokdonella sp.]
MNRAVQTDIEPPAPDRMRPLRYAIRVPLLLLLASITPPIALLALNPVAASIRIGDTSLEKFMIRWWSGRLVRVFGFRIRCFGETTPGAVLYVANHISWLDIVLMHGARPVSFVAKSEIEGWPFVGWLSVRSGTI